MEKFKFILGIIVCKILIFVGKAFGKKGSSAPGQLAMKICPDILTRLSSQVEKGIVCTLGTNGKTTTNNMIDLIMRYNGNETVCNNVGANMLYGVVTAFALNADVLGRLRKPYASIEIDEASAKIVFKYLKPDYIVLTNLFRDQLDRYGEIEMTMEHIKKAILSAPNATLIVNADDPLCKYIADTSENTVVTYGISESVLDALNETTEGRFCKNCGAELKYDYYHYSHLGNYDCPKCDFTRGKPDFEATGISANGKISFKVNENIDVKSNTYGFYNIYNFLAAIAVSETLGLGTQDFTKAFSRYKPQIARMEEFKFGDKTIILNLSKNPAGFNQSISVVDNDERKKAVIIAINDKVSDGMDISWLYDVDFEKLKDKFVKYGVSGKRKYDMALRLFYGDVCDKPEIGDEPADMAVEFLKSDAEVIYLLVNYTVIFEAENRLKKLHREYLKKEGKMK